MWYSHTFLDAFGDHMKSPEVVASCLQLESGIRLVPYHPTTSWTLVCFTLCFTWCFRSWDILRSFSWSSVVSSLSCLSIYHLTNSQMPGIFRVLVAPVELRWIGAAPVSVWALCGKMFSPVAGCTIVPSITVPSTIGCWWNIMNQWNRMNMDEVWNHLSCEVARSLHGQVARCVRPLVGHPTKHGAEETGQNWTWHFRPLELPSKRSWKL